jgi:integrase
MASIIDDPGGRKRILFFDGNGDRRAVRLGKASQKLAESFKVKIEQLASATKLGHVPDDDTIRWLSERDDATHAKLARAGLIAPRESCQLGPWLDAYLAERKNLKPGSLAHLQLTKKKLVDYFTPKKQLRAITPNDASEWRAHVAAGKLSDATIKGHVGNAKGLMAEALRRRLISNPFEHLKSGATAAANERYVTPVEAAAIVEALPNAEFKLVFGLARYAGLRSPSETHLLTWADVDLAAGKLNVRSVKTERFKGHERRTVPITPELAKLLQDRFVEAGEGEETIVSKTGGHLRRTMAAAVKRAGLEEWDDLFQTLRRSCEIDWASTFPQFAVSKWIGHSITVSGKHYANLVPEELFAKAAQKAAQSTADDAGQSRTREEPQPVSAAKEPTKQHQSQKKGVDGNREKIGATGFEPAAFWSQTRRSAKLSYAPDYLSSLSPFIGHGH